MRGLALLSIIALVGCADHRDDASRYLEDAPFRRSALEASLVNPGNGYSQLRLAHYAVGTAPDWDRLPSWNPAVASVGVGGAEREEAAALDLGGAAGGSAGLVALGRAAFFRYPAQLASFASAPLESTEAMSRFGFWIDDQRGAGGLVSVHFDDGTRGLALTCSTCHAHPEAGQLVAGLANQDLDIGALVAGVSWGRGRIDVALPAGEEPIQIPDLRPLAWLTHLHRDGTVRNGQVALAIRIETLIVTAHGQLIRPPREISLALATYLWSLASSGSPALRPPASGSAAERGAMTFASECARCHVPPGSSGPIVPLDVIGTDPRVGRSRDRGTGGYRAPSLRGVADRGPLLHDGSVPNLEAMFSLTRAAPGHRFGTEWTDEVRADLLTYLRSL